MNLISERKGFMFNTMTIALILFALTYILLLALPVRRHWVALISAALFSYSAF